MASLIPPLTRLLLVEDDPEMRRLLAGLLRRDGVVVAEAASGTEALVYLTDRQAEGEGALPDLIVMDVRMPDMTGLCVLERLRAHRVWTPTVLITAFGDVETHEAGARLGAAAMLDKPFEIQNFRQVVAQALCAAG